MRGDRLRIEVDFDVTEEIPGLDLAVLVTATSGARVFDELLSDSTVMRFAARWLPRRALRAGAAEQR